MMAMKNQEQDRLAEHIHQLEAENNQLTGKLKAANREIERMHKQVLLAKAAAKEATEDVGAMSAALYIGATLRDTAYPPRTAPRRPASRSSTGSLRSCTA